MAGRTRVVRGKARGPKDQVWTALLLNGVAVDDNPAISRDIVTAADWAVGGGFERGTILRVRGWLICQPPIAVPSTLFMTVGLQDKDLVVGFAQPVVAATYIDEDIMWSAGQSVAVTAAANDLWVPPLIVDIKTMRKITAADDLRLTMQTTGPAAANWSVSGVLRALVRRGGN